MNIIIGKPAQERIVENFANIITNENGIPFMDSVPELLKSVLIAEIVYNFNERPDFKDQAHAAIGVIVMSFPQYPGTEFITNSDFESIMLALVNIPRILKETLNNQPFGTEDQNYVDVKSDAVIGDITSSLEEWMTGCPTYSERTLVLDKTLELLHNWKKEELDEHVIERSHLNLK